MIFQLLISTALPPDPDTSIKFPAHLQPTWEASHQLMRHPAADVLQKLASTSRRVVIVHDQFKSCVVQDSASIPNAESYSFKCISVFSFLSFLHHPNPGKPFPIDEELRKLMPILEECTTYDVQRLGASQQQFLKFSSGSLHNTSRVIEGLFPDLFKQGEFSQNRKQWFIGPILPVNPDLISNKKHNVCFEWLDEQPPNSVLYVSFGTMTSVTDMQARELAMGLEQSKQRFMWVLRDADKGNIFSGKPRRIELPEGFEERVKGRGLVVRDWAPQPEILAQLSTGGFMRHCGWNSCIESITLGVPMAAWPMHSDQPSNSFLVARILRTRMMVMEWEKRTEVVNASTVENVVRRLMASQEGDEMRKRAQELGEDVRRSVEGGVSRMELDSFISHITR